MASDECGIRYLFEAKEPAELQIELARRPGGEIVKRITKAAAEPFEVQEIAWKGTQSGGKPVASGRYEVDVGVADAQSKRTTGEFTYASHKFPVRGKHSYGGGLGAGRNHQGQDVLARCKIPIVAARGGVVKTKGFSRRGAGNFVVIDAKRTRNDYAYLHMKRPASVEKGERVRTGERIGLVGSTGRSSGCHLHFEIWSAPGWMDGGKPIDPAEQLKRWDRYS